MRAGGGTPREGGARQASQPPPSWILGHHVLYLQRLLVHINQISKVAPPGKKSPFRVNQKVALPGKKSPLQLREFKLQLREFKLQLRKILP